MLKLLLRLHLILLRVWVHELLLLSVLGHHLLLREVRLNSVWLSMRLGLVILLRHHLLLWHLTLIGVGWSSRVGIHHLLGVRSLGCSCLILLVRDLVSSRLLATVVLRTSSLPTSATTSTSTLLIISMRLLGKVGSVYSRHVSRIHRYAGSMVFSVLARF